MKYILFMTWGSYLYAKKKKENKQPKREKRQDNWAQCMFLYRVLYQGKETATLDVLGTKEDQKMPALNVPIWHEGNRETADSGGALRPSNPA